MTHHYDRESMGYDEIGILPTKRGRTGRFNICLSCKSWISRPDGLDGQGLLDVSLTAPDGCVKLCIRPSLDIAGWVRIESVSNCQCMQMLNLTHGPLVHFGLRTGKLHKIFTNIHNTEIRRVVSVWVDFYFKSRGCEWTKLSCRGHINIVGSGRLALGGGVGERDHGDAREDGPAGQLVLVGGARIKQREDGILRPEAGERIARGPAGTRHVPSVNSHVVDKSQVLQRPAQLSDLRIQIRLVPMQEHLGIPLLLETEVGRLEQALIGTKFVAGHKTEIMIVNNLSHLISRCSVTYVMTMGLLALSLSLSTCLISEIGRVYLNSLWKIRPTSPMRLSLGVQRRMPRPERRTLLKVWENVKMSEGKREKSYPRAACLSIFSSFSVVTSCVVVTRWEISFLSSWAWRCSSWMVLRVAVMSSMVLGGLKVLGNTQNAEEACIGTLISREILIGWNRIHLNHLNGHWSQVDQQERTGWTTTFKPQETRKMKRTGEKKEAWIMAKTTNVLFLYYLN